MDYETCLKAVIAAVRTDGGANAETDIAMYSGYPVPATADWADVLEKTSSATDPENPCRGYWEYELRLHRRGIQTVLGARIREYEGLATSGGMPLEHIVDVLELYQTMRSESSRKDLKPYGPGKTATVRRRNMAVLQHGQSDCVIRRTQKAVLEASGTQCNNAYALRHKQLRRQILAAATVDVTSLEDAAIEISDEWLGEQFRHASDCVEYGDDFEFMKRLNANGVLDYGLIDELARHDVFLALARYENNVAAFLLGSEATAAGWRHDEAVRFGLRAALAAKKAYEFALSLKASHAEEPVAEARPST